MGMLARLRATLFESTVASTSNPINQFQEPERKLDNAKVEMSDHETCTSNTGYSIQKSWQNAETDSSSAIYSALQITRGITAINRTCVACANDLPLHDFAAFPLTSSCVHENSACTPCVQQWVKTQLASRNWNSIKCLECEEIMQYDDVKRHVDATTFEKYDRLAALSVYNGHPDFMWCLDPLCGSGQVHEGGEDMPIFRCMLCRNRYCVIHQVPWHSEETCRAFDRRMNGESLEIDAEEMDAETARLIEREGLAHAMPRAEVMFAQAPVNNYGLLRKNRNMSMDENLANSLQDKLNQNDDEVFARSLQKEFAREDKQKEAERKAEHDRLAYQKRKVDEAAGEQTVRSVSKQCPKCHWSIQRISGCEHVSTSKITHWRYLLLTSCR